MTNSKAVIRVLIADDHTIFRAGLKSLITDESGIQVVGEACDGDEIVKLVESLKPDVLLLDLRMPRVSGLEVLQSLAETHATVRTILLSGAVNIEEISKAFELGARGIVMKEYATNMLIKSIRTVMAGQYWIGQKSVSNLAQTLKQYRNSAKSDKPKNYGLTAREMDILRAVV
jgi:DNA-binding NarL/FixJ family response regulator